MAYMHINPPFVFIKHFFRRFDRVSKRVIYGVAFSVIKNNMKKFVIFITTDAPHFSLFQRLLLSSE